MATSYPTSYPSMARKREQSRKWGFTLNNPYDHGYQSHNVLEEFELCEKVQYASFSLEKGDEGTPHFQGYVQFKGPIQLSYLRKHFMGGKAHWDRKSLDGLVNRNYTIKECLDGPWVFGSPVTQGQRTDLEAAVETMKDQGLDAVKEEHPAVYVKYHAGMEKLNHHFVRKRKRAAAEREHDEETADIEWHAWQQDILRIVDHCSPQRRAVYWFWEETGNIGKSTIVRELILKRGAMVLQGAVKDMACAYQKMYAPICIFDLCRSQQECLIGVMQFIEQLKNGFYCAAKYDSDMEVFPCPHVFCFANFEFPYGMLSADRVKCFNISAYQSMFDE